MNKKITLLVCILLCTFSKAQTIEIINKNYDNNNCIISCKVKIDISNYNSSNSFSLNIKNRNSVPLTFSNGVSYVDINNITNNIELLLFENRVTIVGLFPIITPVALNSIKEYKCSNDFDLDGVINNSDNCPYKSNFNQADIDNDGIGDVCDPLNDIDYDNDGVLNGQDNCPRSSNSNQADKDNDGIGDVCDTKDNRDFDSDGVQNWEDDCPNVRGSINNNGCPLIDTDGDGVYDNKDTCPNRFGISERNGCPVLNGPDFEHYFTPDITSTKYTNVRGFSIPTFSPGESMLMRSKVWNFGSNHTNFTILSEKLTSLEVWVSRTEKFDIENSILLFDFFPDLSQSGSNYEMEVGYRFSRNTEYFPETGHYYLFYVLDSKNKINETDEDNNIEVQEIYFDKEGQSSRIDINIFLDDELNGPAIFSRNITSNKNKIYIDSITQITNGIKIFFDRQSDEKDIIKKLPRGFYVIQYANGNKRKIFVK